MQPDFDKVWQSLTEQARQAPAEEAGVPYGFTTRVIAEWKTTPKPSVFHAMSVVLQRSLLASMAVLAVCAAFYCWPVERTLDADDEIADGLVVTEDLL